MLRHSQHFLRRTLIFFVGFLSVCAGSWGRSRGFRRIKEESKTEKNSWGTCGSILWRADDFQNALRVGYPFKHGRCFNFFNFWPRFVKVQWNISFGTPLFKGHKIWPWKKMLFTYTVIFVSVTSIEGTPLLRGKEHFFWCRNPGLSSISTQNVTDHKEGWKL